MRPSTYIAGESRQGEAPDWRPLEDLLGSDELCDHFMWMFDVELDDGTILNAYKHRWTRCYFHLACDARTFYYAGDHHYGEVDPHTAIKEVFANWDCCKPTASEKAALRAALRRARAATN
jgi:hypothetical protein